MNNVACIAYLKRLITLIEVLREEGILLGKHVLAARGTRGGGTGGSAEIQQGEALTRAGGDKKSENNEMTHHHDYSWSKE